MRKRLKMRVFATVAACVLGLSGTGQELQLVYADTEDVEVEEDVIIEEGYVSEDGKWDCTLVKHEYESDDEVRQIVEISIASYREKVGFGDSKEIIIPEKMRVRQDESEEWSEEYYVTRIDSMDTTLLKYNVKEVTSVTLPKTVISIGDEAFRYMKNLEEVNISQTTDEGIEKAMLESYWMLNDTVVGSSAFRECENLISVDIPLDTTEIGAAAFRACGKLENIELPNGVARIGEDAFSGSALTELNLPESITEIGASAFSRCYNLTAIELPPELTEIASGTFFNCTGLTEIAIPSKVTVIGAAAFRACENLAEVSFGDAQIETLEVNAFAECDSLTSISLPDTITEIGDRGFASCTSLTSVKLPEQLTYISSNCFSECESLIAIVIPDSVEEIGFEAFEKCTSLETIVIPKDTVCNYTKFAFSLCDEKKLTFYAEEGSWVMEYLDADPRFDFRFIPVHGAVSEVLDTEDGWKYMENTEEGIKIVGYDGGLENLVIPEFPDAEVTSVSGRILQDNTTIKSIQIPDTVTYIGADAFNGCTGLTKINIPSALEYIGDNALKDCQPMKDTKLPEHIRYIGENSFCGWTELEKVVIPADVEGLGENAFKGCTKLESVEFKGVSETELEGEFDIGIAAFKDCNLKSLTLPNNCSGINSKAFSGNANLKTVVLPDNMYISDRVFNDCAALESINLPSTLPNVCEYVFYGCEKLSRITIPEGVEMIDNGAFYGCASLSEINIPDTVTYIGSNAFNGCSNLTNITLPKALERIGSHAFVECTDISEITIPETVTYIGTEAFDGCSSLTKVTIPSKDTLIKESTFTGCPSLTIYTVSDSDALRYAKEYSIPYVLLDGGDNTGDGNGSEGDNDNPETIDIAKATLTLSQTSYTYDGTAKTPTVAVVLDGKTLALNTDYTVSYSNNTNAGTAGVTVTGEGKYTGSKAAYFTIVKAAENPGENPVENPGENPVGNPSVNPSVNPGGSPGVNPNVSITCNKTVYNVIYGVKPFKIDASSKNVLTFISSDTKIADVDKNTGTVTIKGTGIATVTVKAGNNAVNVTVKVNPKKASLKSAKPLKGKKLTVKWAKDKNASGYQVQVSTDRNFKKNRKQKNLTKTSYTFQKLKAGKKYYVRVRSYKKAGNETLYGAWSGKKQSGKVKK